MCHFDGRGCDGLRTLQSASFKIAFDGKYRSYLKMTSNETEKTLNGLDFNGKRKEPRTYKNAVH